MAGRLTKDLLRHCLMLERLLSFAVTCQEARLRPHGEEAQVMVGKTFLSARALSRSLSLRCPEPVEGSKRRRRESELFMGYLNAGISTIRQAQCRNVQ